MLLLKVGEVLVYIRNILDHATIQTNYVYAQADSKQKW